jgi:hypothetical protein
VDTDIEQAPPGQAQYGRSWVLAAVQARQASDHTQLRPRAELTAYLQSPLEQTEDVVGWWGVSLFSHHCKFIYLNFIQHHQLQFPTLSRMARDYLAIQGSSTASEHAFSSGGLTGTKRRNRLIKDVFENLQLLKSAYRNCHISAASDAEQHLDSLIAALHDNTDDEDGELV